MTNPVIPDGEDVVPPRGYVLVRAQDGQLFWVAPGELQAGPVASDLTSAQIERIKAVKAVLREHDLPLLRRPSGNSAGI